MDGPSNRERILMFDPDLISVAFAAIVIALGLCTVVWLGHAAEKETRSMNLDEQPGRPS